MSEMGAKSKQLSGELYSNKEAKLLPLKTQTFFLDLPLGPFQLANQLGTESHKDSKSRGWNSQVRLAATMGREAKKHLKEAQKRRHFRRKSSIAADVCVWCVCMCVCVHLPLQRGPAPQAVHTAEPPQTSSPPCLCICIHSQHNP